MPCRTGGLAAQRRLQVSSGPMPPTKTAFRRNAMNPPVRSPALKGVKSVREQVSAEEWQARVDLAACYRLTAMHGMTEVVPNHISCRLPAHQEQLLVNACGLLYAEIAPPCLI